MTGLALEFLEPEFFKTESDGEGEAATDSAVEDFAEDVETI